MDLMSKLYNYRTVNGMVFTVGDKEPVHKCETCCIMLGTGNAVANGKLILGFLCLGNAARSRSCPSRPALLGSNLGESGGGKYRYPVSRYQYLPAKFNINPPPATRPNDRWRQRNNLL